MIFSLMEQIRVSGRWMKGTVRRFDGSRAGDDIFHAENGRMVSGNMVRTVTIGNPRQLHFKGAGRIFRRNQLV